MSISTILGALLLAGCAVIAGRFLSPAARFVPAPQTLAVVTGAALLGGLCWGFELRAWAGVLVAYAALAGGALMGVWLSERADFDARMGVSNEVPSMALYMSALCAVVVALLGDGLPASLIAVCFFAAVVGAGFADSQDEGSELAGAA